MRNIALILALVIALCPSVFSQEPEDPNAPKVVIKKLEKITDFELRDLAGTPVKSADFRKGKILVLSLTPGKMNFEGHITNMSLVMEKYMGKVVVLDVIIKPEKKNDELLEIYQQKQASFTAVIDPDGKATEHLAVNLIKPLVIVIDKNGAVQSMTSYSPHTSSGNSMYRRLAEEINKVLEMNEAPAPAPQPRVDSSEK